MIKFRQSVSLCSCENWLNARYSHCGKYSIEQIYDKCWILWDYKNDRLIFQAESLKEIYKKAKVLK